MDPRPRFRLVDERAAVWNGRPVELEPSEESATGYLNVCYQAGRSKPFYAKAKVDEGKPRTIPGTNSTTAWEAAAKYAYFKAFWEGPLPEKQVRSKRSSSEVSARPSAASARSAFTCRLFVSGDVHHARGKEGQEGGEAGGKSRKKGGGERRAGSGGPGHARAAVQRSAAAWQPGADAADAEPSAPHFSDAGSYVMCSECSALCTVFVGIQVVCIVV